MAFDTSQNLTNLIHRKKKVSSGGVDPCGESPGEVLHRADCSRHRVGLQGESSSGSRMIQIEELVKDRFVANESPKYFHVNFLESVDYVSDHKITHWRNHFSIQPCVGIVGRVSGVLSCRHCGQDPIQGWRT